MMHFQIYLGSAYSGNILKAITKNNYKMRIVYRHFIRTMNIWNYW